MRERKHRRKIEKGQSTLEMIAIAPMLFGFIYMVFNYGIPIYYKLAAQNSAYSYALAFTRMPVPNISLYSTVAVDVAENIPGISFDNQQTIINRNWASQGYLTDIQAEQPRSQLVDTMITSGYEYSPGFFEWKGMKGGAIAPNSPFISCPGKEPDCFYFDFGAENSWLWK